MTKDIFISFVEEDSAVAVELRRLLETAGFTTWDYLHDTLPGQTYLAGKPIIQRGSKT